MLQISYPFANGASQGNYFLPKNNKLAVFEEKTGLQKQLCSQSWKLDLPCIDLCNIGFPLKKDIGLQMKITPHLNTPIHPSMHQPSLPVNPDPNPTPPNR